MKYLIITLLMLVVFIFGGVLGRITTPREVSRFHEPFTGQDILAELNSYRQSIGLSAFELSPQLCNNIVERWQNYKDNNSHEGLDEFNRRNHPKGFSLSEILTIGGSAKESVQGWVGSPSHEILIRSNSKVCVYTSGGLSVALLSN